MPQVRTERDRLNRKPELLTFSEMNLLNRAKTLLTKVQIRYEQNAHRNDRIHRCTHHDDLDAAGQLRRQPII